jgi:hypothetical protein
MLGLKGNCGKNTWLKIMTARLQRNTWTVLWLLLGTMKLLSVESFHGNAPPNKFWECRGCANERQKSLMFNYVRQALHSGSREVYWNFDHSWIDSALSTGSRVVVTAVKRYELEHFRYDDLTSGYGMLSNGHSPFDFFNQTYHVVISLALNVSRDSIEPIDKFLVNNPCFMPIRDPQVEIGPNNTYVQKKGSTGNIAVFVRLPELHYHSTCALYKLVSEKQYPQQCPRPRRDTAKIQPHWLGNIGWSNCADSLVHRFIQALHESKLLLATRSEAHNGVDKDPNKALYVTVEDRVVKVKGTWDAWASRYECDTSTFAWNPWACHFLSLSNCHSPAMQELAVNSVVPVGAPFKDPPEGSDYLSKLVRHTLREYIYVINVWQFDRSHIVIT